MNYNLGHIEDIQALFFKEHPEFSPRKTDFCLRHMSYIDAYLDKRNPHERDVCQMACYFTACTESKDQIYLFRYYPEGNGKREHGKQTQHWIADKYNPPVITDF